MRFRFAYYNYFIAYGWSVCFLQEINHIWSFWSIRYFRNISCFWSIIWCFRTIQRFRNLLCLIHLPVLSQQFFCLKLPVDFIKLYPVVHHHRLKLGKRLVDDFLENRIRGKGDFISSLDDDALASVDIHALPILHRSNLEGSKPFHLYLLVSLEPFISYIKHLSDEQLGILLTNTSFLSQLLCQYSQTVLTHKLLLHSLAFPWRQQQDESRAPV